MVVKEREVHFVQFCCIYYLACKDKIEVSIFLISYVVVQIDSVSSRVYTIKDTGILEPFGVMTILFVEHIDFLGKHSEYGFYVSSIRWDRKFSRVEMLSMSP